VGTVHVLVVGAGQGGFSEGGAGCATDLRGAGPDAQGWLRRLDAMGVRRDAITALCSLPGGRVPAWADAPATLGALRQALSVWARQLAQDPDAHGLLLVSGHGRAGSLVLADGTLPLSEVSRLLDRHVDDRGIITILDLCWTDGAAPGLRPQDLVIHSADGRHPAEEHRDGDRWQGAFSWAAQRVIDRWLSVGPHGALVPISPAVLVQQATKVLDGLGYAQRPVVAGPDAICQRGLLGGRRVQHAPLAVAVTREFDPGNNDGFTIYDIKKMDGTRLGVLVVTGPQWTPSPGWAAGREYWSTAIPSSDFKLVVAANQTLPGSVPSLAYQHISFTGVATSSYTVATPGWAVKSGGSIVGYMHWRANGLDWYMTTNPITATYPSGTLVLSQLGASKNITNAAHVNAAKI